MRSDEGRRFGWLNHERRVFLLSLLAGLPAVIALARAAPTRRLHRRRSPGRSARSSSGVGSSSRSSCANESFGRCRRSRTCWPRCVKATSRCARAARSPTTRSALALLEVNTLGNTLQAQRLGAMEATALLRTVMAEIDVAIFAFDAGNQLRLANRAGERLLGQPIERLLGRTADALGLESFLAGDSPARVRPRVSRTKRTLGSAPHDVSAGRPAAHARGDVRSEQDAAGGRAARLAAPRPRAQPRDQQLAHADQVDRRKSAQHSGSNASSA